MCELHTMFISRTIEITSQNTCHGIRIARQRSPQQMFLQGFLRLRLFGLVAMGFSDAVDGNYEISIDDLLPEESGSVTVTESHYSISADEMHLYRDYKMK
uniref:Uncharacterized protein n=1 Tax=Amphimedon queenslandica TaxID=400682 RepID=A0A1X7TBW1_AMPQE